MINPQLKGIKLEGAVHVFTTVLSTSTVHKFSLLPSVKYALHGNFLGFNKLLFANA